MILFADEAGFCLHPKLGRMWSKKGAKQPMVLTKSEHKKRVNVMGWVDPIKGLHGMLKIISGNRHSFLDFLSHIKNKFKNKIIDLWVDGPPWHKGDNVRSFCRIHKNIKIHYLPAYHPNLNYQERLWRIMRYEETTSVYFESLDQLKKAVFKRSQRWKPNKIASLCQLI